MAIKHKELIQTILAAQASELSPEAFAKLEALLQNEAEARRVYLRLMQIQSTLEVSPFVLDDGIERSTSRSTAGRGAWAWIWLPVAAVLMAGIAWLAFRGGFSSGTPSPEIATLIFAEDCEWNSDRAHLTEGESMNAGKVQLKRGMAVLRFGSGAEMVLNGRSSLELLSNNSARLFSGEVVVRAEEGADGFRVETPRGGVTDLGTEFTVRVDDSGETQIHVHEGKVALEDSIVEAGDAATLGEQNAESVAGHEAVPPRYQDLIAKAAPRERRELMTAYEGFYLPEGNYAPEDIIKGKGWASPWRVRDLLEQGTHPENSIDEMSIGHGKMTVPWPVRGGKKGMLQLPVGTAIWIRQMQAPIRMEQSGVSYMSFLVADEVAPTASEDPHGSFRLTLRSSDDYFGESLSVGWSGKRQLRLQTNTFQAARSIREIPAGETVFCVGKILRRSNHKDRIQFRFYRATDRLDFAEPAEWDVTLGGFELDAEFDLLLITSHGNTSRWVDEIRVGPSWRSVTPIDALILTQN